MKYYQPKLSEREWEATDLHTFEVYNSRYECEKAFPGKEILEFSGQDIEGHMTVD